MPSPKRSDPVGLAIQVVLDTLASAERLTFAPRDLLELPFDGSTSWYRGSPRPGSCPSRQLGPSHKAQPPDWLDLAPIALLGLQRPRGRRE